MSTAYSNLNKEERKEYIARSAKWGRENRDRRNESARKSYAKRALDPEKLARIRESKNKWYSANRESMQAKRKARSRVTYAMACGTLIKPDRCSKCGKQSSIDAHHHKGYDEENWLEVVWLCKLCHGNM